MIEKFIDYTEIHISSGHGGAGAISFRREKFVPKGGPDGGDGGKGGNLIFRLNPQLSNFSHFKGKKIFKAKNGLPGMGKRKFGKDGESLIIQIPPGTILKTQNNILLHDFGYVAKEYIFLEGGKGGLGNYHFKTATKQKPHYAQKGIEGKNANIILEIKLIADIGLVGYPNAGKSTLLSTLTNARPKIANYPFTTLTPNLGVFQFDREHSLVIADIPGITDKAHTGYGLGIEFLRHIERTQELFFLIDATSKDPYQDFINLQNELKNYSQKLFKKDYHILLTKKDLIDEIDNDIIKNFPEKIKELVLVISSVSKEGFDELKKVLGKAIEKKRYL